MTPSSPPPSFAEALRFWTKLGFISFGGPSGQIAVMHGEIVERRGWVENERFLHALNFCMLLPGPEATQLAVYLGWLMHGVRGGLAAGVLFIAPAVVLLWGLSWLYAAGGHLPALAAVFNGLKPAVLAIVAAAVWRLGGKALRTPARWSLALGSFAAIYFFKAPFPLVVLAAGVIGWLDTSGKISRQGAEPQRMKGELGEKATVTPISSLPSAPWRLGVRLRSVLIGLALWLGPTLAAGVTLGWDSTLARMGRFFSGAALVTFGGAYAVLPYVGQRAVGDFGWLTPGQMMDGLGLAETTPGPLIMVLQFVGFLGAWRHPDAGLSPLAAGTLGALLTTWATFAPSFGFIFLGAPHVERLRADGRLSGALGSITAAVVGVMLNLAVWFAWGVLFPGDGQGGLDGFALAVALGALAALTWGRRGVVSVVLTSASSGWLRGEILGGGGW